MPRAKKHYSESIVLPYTINQLKDYIYTNNLTKELMIRLYNSNPEAHSQSRGAQPALYTTRPSVKYRGIYERPDGRLPNTYIDVFLSTATLRELHAKGAVDEDNS